MLALIIDPTFANYGKNTLLVNMPTVRDLDTEEEFEIIGVQSRNWIRNTMGDLSKASVAKQVGVGTATGWLAGYMFCKVGKAAAVTIGGSLLIMQVAQHRGYIKVNWTKLEREVQKAKKELGRSTQSQLPKVVEEVKEFFNENMFLAGGFAAGFFLGLAT